MQSTDHQKVKILSSQTVTNYNCMYTTFTPLATVGDLLILHISPSPLLQKSKIYMFLHEISS